MWSGQAAAAPATIYYNQGNGLKAETLFSFKLLQLVIAKSRAPYVLKPSPLGTVTEIRAKEAMVAGETMDVAMLGAMATNDAMLLPVPIPLDRGLLGYRVFLIDGARQAEFERIRGLKDLRRLAALQGQGWADTDILRHAGVTVWTGRYERLFEMMNAGRADFFPRGAAEAHSEVKAYAPVAPRLAVERTLMLRYRFTSLFYVSPRRPRLRDDLHRGFLTAWADGSYQRLFDTDPDISAAVSILRQGQRRIIDLANPTLSPAVRRAPEHFWFKP